MLLRTADGTRRACARALEVPVIWCPPVVRATAPRSAAKHTRGGCCLF
jgi:hypothetical protein